MDGIKRDLELYIIHNTYCACCQVNMRKMQLSKKHLLHLKIKHAILGIHLVKIYNPLYQKWSKSWRSPTFFAGEQLQMLAGAR